MPHTFSRLLFHIVFGTKERTPTMNDDLRGRLWPYLGGVVRELGGTPIAINGTADHVHLLTTLSPSTAVADGIRVIKTNSSKWIHDTFPNHSRFAWQTGYGAFSVSESRRTSWRAISRDKKSTTEQ